MQSFHVEIFQMTAIGGPSRLSRVEVQGPDPGWIGTLFYHLRTLVVENAFFCQCPMMGPRLFKSAQWPGDSPFSSTSTPYCTNTMGVPVRQQLRS